MRLLVTGQGDEPVVEVARGADPQLEQSRRWLDDDRALACGGKSGPGPPDVEGT